MKIYNAAGLLVEPDVINAENIANKIGVGNPCKTPFGHPKYNKWRKGIFAGLSSYGMGRIRVKYRNGYTLIARPMCDIYPDK